MQCSSPGCKADAVLQWSQLLNDADSTAHVEKVRQKLTEVAEVKRLDLRVRIAALQDAIESPPENLSPQDLEAFKARGQRQIDGLQAEHDRVPITFDLEHHRVNAVKSLFTCEQHKHADLDWYARIHAADCSGEMGCGCP